MTWKIESNYTLYHMYHDVVEKNPDRPAFHIKDKVANEWNTIKYKDWYEDVKKLGLGLIDMGVSNDYRVALLMDNRLEFTLCSAAINSIGGVDVPRGTDVTHDDLNYIINHAKTKIAIVENQRVLDKLSEQIDNFPELHTIIFIEPSTLTSEGKKILSLDDVIKKGGEILAKDGDSAFHEAGKAIKPENTYCIVYTSGTTSAPKGVVLKHLSMYFEAHYMIDHFRATPDDVSMAYLPPWHIAERLLETSITACGASNAYTTIPSLAVDLGQIKPTIFLGVPRVWEGIYNKIHDGVRKGSGVKRGMFSFFERLSEIFMMSAACLKNELPYYQKTNPFVMLLKKLVNLNIVIFLAPMFYLGQALVFSKIKAVTGNRVRTAISGAGALPHYIDLFFRCAGVKISEVYGLTETTGVSTRRDIDNPKFMTVGKPGAGVEIQLRDDKGNVITEPGVKGVAHHKGPNIMLEYYQEAQKTKEVFDGNGWFDSGDILMWTIDGDLSFAGRAKDTMVLLGGENIEPLPIEQILSRCIYINQIMITGQDKKTLTALIVPAFGEVTTYFESQGEKISDDYTTWNQDQKIRKLFSTEIKQYVSQANGFKAFERISNFTLLSEEFRPGHEMTNTMKIKRNVVADKFAKEIEGMYK